MTNIQGLGGGHMINIQGWGGGHMTKTQGLGGGHLINPHSTHAPAPPTCCQASLHTTHLHHLCLLSAFTPLHSPAPAPPACCHASLRGLAGTQGPHPVPAVVAVARPGPPPRPAGH